MNIKVDKLDVDNLVPVPVDLSNDESVKYDALVKKNLMLFRLLILEFG